MKFLFWLNIGFDRHGPSVHLLKGILQECLAAGHEVVVVALNTGGSDPDIPPELERSERLVFEVVHRDQGSKGAFAKRYIDYLLYYRETRKLLKKHRDADAVFLQSCYYPLQPIRMAHRLNMPVLFNVQNIFPIDAGMLQILPTRGIKGMPYRLLRWLQRRAYKKADCNVTISGDMCKTLLNEGAPKDRLEVVYNWSYDDHRVEIPDAENLFLGDHPEFRDKFRVVFAGNLGSMVNYAIFADAAEALLAYPDIAFIVIGDGNNMNRLKAAARERGLNNMYFFPYQPEAYARHNYAMAHVNINALPKGIITTCMPSKTATMLNSARPMVVAVEKDSDYARILREVDKCTVVEWDDSKGFIEGILKVYNTGDYSDSANSRDVFRKYCSRDNARDYVRLLEKTAKNARKQARGE